MDTQIHPSNEALAALLETVPDDRLVPLFKRHTVSPQDGVDALVSKISLDGGNSVMSVIRKGKGVPYDKIVRDVAGKMNAKPNVDETVSEIELKLLEELIRRYLAKATPEEREKVQEVLERTGKDHQQVILGIIKGSLSAGTLALLVKRVGQKAVADIVNVVVFQTIAKKTATEAARRAAQVAGWAVPFLNAIIIGWTVMDIAGPAYRKTIPTVLEVALLRLEFSNGEVR